MKIVAPEYLKDLNICADVIDSHITEWKSGDHFEKFRKTDRPFSALVFILSDIENTYVETDKNGTELQKVLCKKGDILFIPQNIRYHAFFEPVPGAGRSNTCTINFDLYDLSGERVLLNEHILLLNNKVNHFMVEDLYNLHKYSRNPVICDKLRINSVFFSILYYATKSKGENKNANAVKAAVRALEEEWNQNKKMSTYAELCNMSMTYFYREFSAFTGMSPTRYRNYIRINAAKSDMINTDMSIKEIARKVGFDDEFYFSRLFKKITGTSPKQFKKG